MERERIVNRVREYTFEDWAASRPDFASFCYTVIAVLGIALFFTALEYGGNMILCAVVVLFGFLMEDRHARHRGGYR